MENTKQDRLHNNNKKDGSSSSGIKTKLQNKCKYDDSYLKLRSACEGDYCVTDAQCVLCYRTLGNFQWFPQNLKWHSLTKHDISKTRLLPLLRGRVSK
jgi:hypothetical protein